MCKPEPGQVYAIDLAIISNKNKIQPTDVKIINLTELLNNKMSNSYINLENAGNSFFFVSTKIKTCKSKNFGKIVTHTVNSVRSPVIGPQSFFKISHNIENEMANKQMDIEISPKYNTRQDSREPALKPQPLFISNADKRGSVIIISNKQKKELNKSYKYIGSNSEIVNLYKKPTKSYLIRN